MLALVGGLFGAAAGVALGEPSPASAATSASQAWVTSVSAVTGSGVGATRTLTFDSGITATETTTAETGSCAPFGTGGAIAGETNVPAFLEPDPSGAVRAANINCTGPLAGGGSRTASVQLSKPVIAPVIHLVNLDASRAGVSGAGITLTELAKNNAMEVAGTTLNSTLQQALQTGCAANDGSNPNGACGSFRLTSATPVTSFTLANNTAGSTLPAAGNNDSWSYTLSYPTAPLTKQFSPAEITVGDTSRLTFRIANPANPTQPTLTPLDFMDQLPAGVTLATAGATAMTGCGPATVDAPAGGTTVTASGISVAAGATCEITVDVTSDTPGSYTNDNDNLSTSVANLIPDADTTLTVTDAPASPIPFVCGAGAPGTLFQQQPTDVFSVDLITGASTQVGSDVFAGNLNAAGYNPADDYMYAFSNSGGGSIYRIGSDWSPESIGMPSNWNTVPAGIRTGLNVGEFDADGHYWVTNSNITAPYGWAEIDLSDPASPTYKQVVSTGTFTMPSTWVLGPDWGFNVKDGDLYATAYVAGSSPATIGVVRFDTGSHTVSLVQSVGALQEPDGEFANALFGAVYTDSDGFLYASNNITGGIWRFQMATGDTVYFAEGPASGLNDGARCFNSPLPIDFGDADDPYGTTLAENGPRHSIPGYDEAAETAPLMLGASVDIETDGRPTAAADGDGADEDALAGPVQLAPGATGTTLTIPVVNSTGAAATLYGWIDSNANGVFEAAEFASVPVPAGATSVDLAFAGIPAAVDGSTPALRLRLTTDALVDDPGTPGVDERSLGAASDGEVEDHLVEVVAPALAITKRSDATAASRPGDTITYTITAENTGDGDYTAANPAVVLDDLSGVLDDATFNNDATASDGPAPTFASPLLSWSGALAAGDSVTIEYTVTLVAGGDGVVRNVAFGPGCVPGTPGCDTTTPVCDPPADGVDPATGIPCAETELLLPRLTHTKVANTTELPADGGEVEYTITVTNQGPGVFTTSAPGSMTDDLSGVLDDATITDGPTADLGTATFDPASESIEWEGPLGVGETATITYTVTYDADAGDNVLRNIACLPAELAADPTDPCRSVQIPGSALQQRKSVNPASGTSVVAGQQVTYTLHFENTGQTGAVVDTFDDLSAVLDDATLTAGPTSSNPALTAVLNGTRLDVDGTVPAGQAYTVSYTVTVNAFAQQGDHVLANVLGGDAACAEGDPTCRTENPIRHLTVTKTSDAAADVSTGDVVTYTVTVRNDGEGDYTAQQPAIAQDDLTRVLDDATYNDDATASAGTVTHAAPILTWTGALAAGDSETIEYTVTVTNAGDHVLENTAGPVCTAPEICEPPVVVTTPLPHVVPAKSSDPATGTALQAGDVVIYTLSWTNDGQAAGAISDTDDLSDVLDDAEVTAEPVASDPAVTAVRTGDEIRVTGPIQPGQTVTVRYEVTVKPDGERGDDFARNVLTPDVPPHVCADGDAGCEPFVPPTTEHPIGELDDWKTVDPASGSTVRAGQEVTYTLHFENTGEADVTVDREDVLTQVLDDATITAAPVSSDPALTVSPVNGDRFAVTGTLAPGQLVTVSYTVTVNADGQRGDDRLGNALVPTGTDPAEECAPADPQRPDCTVNHVSNVIASKSADPASGTKVSQGQRVTYTLSFENVSRNPLALPAPIDYTDHMAGVLDDAAFTEGPVSSAAGVTAVRDGDTIRVTGAVPSGEIVTVTYTVTVKAYDQQADHHLGNVVAVTGEDPICAPGSRLCTEHDLVSPPPGLAVTGGAIAWFAALSGFALLLAGGVLVVNRRRGLTADA